MQNCKQSGSSHMNFHQNCLALEKMENQIDMEEIEYAGFILGQILPVFLAQKPESSGFKFLWADENK